MTVIIEQQFEELESTFSLVSDPTNLQFLEITPESITSEEIGFDRTGRLRAWQQLQNAVHSITDIRNSRHGLVFVGVLGHFTSGKSSLINALLEIGQNETPGYKRRVGPHPTDTSITLICHQDSRQALEENAITSINDVNIVHGPPLPFLRNIVLVDTPGLGNAVAEHDLAERFLHLCHVIIITVDGMVPFADTAKDFDLLDKAINRLVGVPKIFAITKSMTFLTHRQGEYDSDWDGERAEAFWREAKERVVADSRFKSAKDELESMHVCFIDSVDQHNIGQLKSQIVPITQDESQRDRIFEAKIDYLVSVAKESIDIFDKHLARRLTNLNALYEEAQRRAAAAENTISSQLIAVQNAISTASQKLLEHENKIASHESIWAVPLPDKALLFERYDSFNGHISLLERKSFQIERDCVNRIREELRSQISRTYGIAVRRQPSFSAEVLPSIIKAIGYEWTDSEMAQTIAELDNYYRSSAIRVAERIWDSQSSELFFMRFDSDKSVLTEVQQAVSGGLGQFLRVYNSAATAFVAYLTQPDARDLLAEYGLILFGDNDDVEIKAATLEVEDFPAWRQIGTVVESAKADIDQRAKNTEDARREADSLEDFDPSDSPFDEDSSLLELCWSSVLDQRLDVAIADLSEKVVPLFEEGIEKQKELRQQLATEIAEIWMVRFELLVRTGVVAGLIGGLVLGLRAIDPALYALVASAVVSDWKNITFGVIGAGVFAALSFVLIGPKNPGLKKLFSTEFRPIVEYFRQARIAKKALTSRVAELLKGLDLQLGGKPLDLFSKVRSIVDEWFQDSEICKPLKQNGDRIQQIQIARRNSFSVTKSKILEQTKSLANEGSVIAHKKREESVERVLKIVTDKRNLIVSLRKELAQKLERLT